MKSRCPKSCPPCRRRLAVAAVELAAMLPLILFLFVVAIDYARIFYYSQVLEQCARNGALYACDSTAQGTSPYASVSAAALADATDLSPQPTVSSTSGTDGSGDAYVQVTVNW